MTGEATDRSDLQKMQIGEATDLMARCGCARCVEATIERQPGVFIGRKMIVCSDCGNKRCPHATDHRLSCTNSNEAGQEGSNYGPPLYRRDQATLIEAQAVEIEEATRLLERFDKEWNSGSGWAIRMDDLGDEVRAFLASRTERADG